MLNDLVLEVEKELKNDFIFLDKLCEFNSKKVLDSFHKNNILSSDFNSTTGYGYGDIGRDKIEKVYASYFNCESALVRNQFVSGTHAITTALFGVLRPNDTLLSITGIPYDSLHKVIGITDNDSSLKSFNIDFKYIDLVNDDFDYNKIRESLDTVKMVHIQRSIGYSNRNTISIDKLEKVIRFIKNINKDIIIFVDNCYCEMCSQKEPTDVGADLVVGSLIKNLGAGICSNGAYIVGKEKLVSLCAERLTSPGLGSEVGPSLGQNKNILLGLFMAPSVVKEALKVKLLTRELFLKLGYSIVNSELDDIVLGIIFNDENKLKKYVQLIQKGSAIDSGFTPCAEKIPGYENDIIMASGSFTDGSSIELSCDGPIKKPFIAYQQGSLTYEYGKIAVVNAIKDMIE